MPNKLDDLKAKLRELFQLNRPDLDFGFYRIMHAKQDEIERFLDQELLPQVKAGLTGLSSGSRQELDEAIQQAKSLGVDPDTIPKVKELQAKYGAPVDLGKTEDAIYSHLLRFFSRYYDAGDFISMRRYKEGVYAIPYEGEEVVLHWANKDQYYVKSSENLRDYTVKLAEGDDAPRLHFKLIEADIEKDNRKAADDKKRVFIFNPEATEVLKNEVVLGFEYRPDASNRKQEAHIEVCVDYVKKHRADFGDFASKLLALKPTDKRKDRTLLEKHLNDYTSSHTMDYFIHKDLGGFLRRELDFYIKNEVMHLDDIENETAPRVEQYLVQIKVLRGIANKLIDFLTQLEDFQKKLWLKKKFVVESNWCITLDRIPEELYPEISANDAQWKEWEKLGFVLKTKNKEHGQLGLDEKDVPKAGTIEYLKAFPFMVIDTAFYETAFKQKLLATIDNIDEQTDGLLIHSENFQALNLLQDRYREQVKCVYIDPPYNTNSTPILYKNEYKHSSWASLLQDRLSLSMSLLNSDGVKIVAIDDSEMVNLSIILQNVAPLYKLTKVTVIHNPKGSITKDFNRVHEYSLFLTKDDNKSYIARTLEKNKTPRKMRRWGENSLRTERRLSFYPIYIKNGQISRIGVVPDEDFHPESKNVMLANGEIEIWPIDQDGVERRWNFGLDSIENNLDRITVIDRDGDLDLFLTHESTVPKTVWSGGEFDAGKYGNTLLIDMIGEKLFDFPKSINLVERCVSIATASENDPIILDYFGGSATTGHAVINLNREDENKRKYVLVEMGAHFDSVTKPRIQKVIFSKDWKDGKPTDPKSGISHCFKYLRLESYEDCLNNLELIRTTEQDDLLSKNAALKEDYTLRYMLDVESKGSLLNVQAFQDPFSYILKVATGSVGETKPVNIDLIETFNYLIGLKVKTMDCIRGVTVLTGENLKGEKILVLWRKVAETDSEALNTWFVKQDYSTLDMEFDLIYVNGDNHLENLRKDRETWKVRLIEEEFQIRMFAGEGV